MSGSVISKQLACKFLPRWNFLLSLPRAFFASVVVCSSFSSGGTTFLRKSRGKSSGREAAPGRDGRGLLREAFSTGDGGNATHRIAASSTEVTILRFFLTYSFPLQTKKLTQRKTRFGFKLDTNNGWTFRWWNSTSLLRWMLPFVSLASHFPLLSQYRIQTRNTHTHTHTHVRKRFRSHKQVAAVVCWWFQLQVYPAKLHFTCHRCFLSFFTPHNDREKLRCQLNGQRSEERKGGHRAPEAERRPREGSRAEGRWMLHNVEKERFRLCPSACRF